MWPFGRRARAVVWRAALVGLGLALGARSAQSADPVDTRALERLLGQHGLVREGNWFLTAEEHLVRQRLSELRALERAFLEAQAAEVRAHAEIDQLAEQFSTAQHEQAELERRLADAALGSKEYNQVVRELNLRTAALNRLRPLFERPEGLWDNADLRSAVRRFSQADAELRAAVALIRTRAVDLDGAYRQLAENTEVATALAAAEGKYKLGPARDYGRELKRLARVDKLLVADRVPIYREDGQLRLGAVLNERTPAVFAYAPVDEGTIVPDELLAAAGVTIPDDAPTGTLQAGADRKIPVRKVTLPQLRLGDLVLTNVEVHAVPEEGHDLGARLGRLAVRDYAAELDPRAQRLKLVPEHAGDPPR